MMERTHLLDHARPAKPLKIEPPARPAPQRNWRFRVTIQINENMQADYDMHGPNIREVLTRAEQRGEVLAIVRKKR